MTQKDKILQKIIRVAKYADPEAEIYLYGSRAKETSHKLSDWDILILLNISNIPFSLETGLMDKIYEIELESGEVISPLIYSKNDWEKNHAFTPLFMNIKNDGIRIQ